MTVFVLLPPLLIKTTTLLKFAELVGLKLTCTVPDAPGERLKGLPLCTAKGGVAETEPVRVEPPVLVNWKLRVLVCPITREPKAKPGGPRANCDGRLVTVI